MNELNDTARHEIGNKVGNTPKLTVQPNDLVELLGIGRNTIYALIRTGRIRSIRVGRKLIIPMSAVDEFLASNGNSLN